MSAPESRVSESRLLDTRASAFPSLSPLGALFAQRQFTSWGMGVSGRPIETLFVALFGELRVALSSLADRGSHFSDTRR